MTFSLAGPRRPPLITVSQILQLAFVTWVWTVTPLRCPLHGAFIQQHFWEFITSYLMVPVYLSQSANLEEVVAADGLNGGCG